MFAVQRVAPLDLGDRRLQLVALGGGRRKRLAGDRGLERPERELGLLALRPSGLQPLDRGREVHERLDLAEPGEVRTLALLPLLRPRDTRLRLLGVCGVADLPSTPRDPG